MFELRWINFEQTVLLMTEGGQSTVIEPGHPQWEAMAQAEGIEPFVPQPAPDPLEVERAGMVVSRFQARAALHLAGLLPQVEAALAQADPLAQIAWADAQEFRRNSPTIAALAGAVGLDDAAIDALFRAARTIEA